MFFCVFLYIILSNYKITWIEAIFFSFALLLSKSLMSILFLPTILLCTRRNYFLILFILSSVPIILFLLQDVSLGRIGHVFGLMQSKGFIYLFFEDASANARLMFILKDVLLSYDYLFLPLGIGSYYLSQSIAGIPIFVIENMVVDYKLNMSGSYIGHFIVEFGAFVILMCILISFFILSQTSNSVRRSFMLLNIIIISTQMISFTFFLLPAAISLLFCRRTNV